MQNIISAKCLKAVENIPFTALLECSLTTRTIMPPRPRQPADRAPPTEPCRHSQGTRCMCVAAAIFSHLGGVCQESHWRVFHLRKMCVTVRECMEGFSPKILYGCSRGWSSPCSLPLPSSHGINPSSVSWTPACCLMTYNSHSFLLQPYRNMAAVSFLKGPWDSHWREEDMT